MNSAPAFSSAGTTNFVVSSAGTFTVTATGYPAPTFVASGAGPRRVTATLNATTGVLGGTPPLGADTTSPYSFTITASNGIGTAATQTFVLYVLPASGIPQINTQPANQRSRWGLMPPLPSRRAPIPPFPPPVVPAGGRYHWVFWRRRGRHLHGYDYGVVGRERRRQRHEWRQIPVFGRQWPRKCHHQRGQPDRPGRAGHHERRLQPLPSIQPGTFTVTATGGPVPTFSAVARVPAGWPLTLNSTTGVLSGTPPLGADAHLSLYVLHHCHQHVWHGDPVLHA